MSLKGKKVFFEDPQSAWSQPRVAYDGTPYVILGKRIYDCQQGADRHAADKMPKEAKEVGGAISRKKKQSGVVFPWRAIVGEVGVLQRITS